MNHMIKKIIDTNKEDLERRKSENSISILQEKISGLPKTLDFKQAFKNGLGIIAEIKLASPSAGDLENAENVLGIAKEYKKGGADAISIITEKYFFKGDINFIRQVKDETELPILQKDFVVDPFQIYESRISGADALLLIAKIISPDELRIFVDLALKIDLEPVVEINDEADLENALQTKVRVIAFNARDLDTFKVDVDRAGALLKKISDQFLKLAFSGVSSRDEVEKYKSAGADGVLVGTNLMKATDKKGFIESLRILDNDRLLDSRIRGNDKEKVQ